MQRSLNGVTALKPFTIRSSNNDRRKSLQPRSFPLLRRKHRRVITKKEERVGSERRMVGIEMIESNLPQDEFQQYFKDYHHEN